MDLADDPARDRVAASSAADQRDSAGPVDHAWIDVPVPDNRGRPAHQRGVTGWPGLCFPGLTWQHTRGLGAPGWVNDDAGYIYIAHQLDVGG